MFKSSLVRTLFVILTFSTIFTHQASASPATTVDGIQRAIMTNKAEVGVEVVSLTKGDAIFRSNADIPMNPASVTKLVITAGALKYLGPDYRFRTQFFYDAKSGNGYVPTLYIKGRGDPSMVIENLTEVARNVVQTGIRKVGKIVVDDTFFDLNDPPGLMRGARTVDGVHTGALSLDFNEVEFTVTPGKPGGPATIKANAGGAILKIVNKTVTSGGKKGRNGIQITMPPTDPQANEIPVIVTGQISANARPLITYRPIYSAALFFGATFRDLLEQNHVVVESGPVSGNVPEGMRPFREEFSKPLSVILQDMNKFSNNFIAEQILKTLGAELGGLPGSTQKGIAVLRKYFADLGIRDNNFYIVNGSGLTYDNRITPTQIIVLIRDMFHNGRAWIPFVESLSIAGVDGTIRHRHRSPLLIGRMRAKTGTLANVSTLAGVLPSSNGEVMAFAIFVNNANASIGHTIQDQIVQAVAEFSR